jgi:hypothetical protein
MEDNPYTPLKRHFKYFDLPKIPQELLIHLKDVATKGETLLDQGVYIQDAGFKYNYVDFRPMGYEENPSKTNYYDIPWQIEQYLKTIFEPYGLGNGPYKILAQKNVYYPKIGYTPPHTDIDRQASVNYLIAEGGSNVTTSFYNCTNPDNHGPWYRRDEVEHVGTIRIRTNEWHAFNSQRPHAVSDLMGYRYALMVWCKNWTFDEMVDKFPGKTFSW